MPFNLLLFGGAQVVASPAPIPLPAMPLLSFSAVTASQASLAWADVVGETGYRVYRSTDGASYTQLGADLAEGTTSYNDTTISADTPYYYKVAAFNVTGETYSNVVVAYYFADDFARADGAVANGWTGTTWSIVSGKARNAPSMGATATLNSDFEGAFTAGVAADWIPSAGATKAEENTIVHSGTKSQKVDAASVAGIIQNYRPFTAGKWYKADFWVYLETASASFAGQVRDANSNYFIDGNWNLTRNVWNNFIRYGKPIAGGTGTSFINGYMNTTSPNVAYHDDYNIFPLAESELMLTRDTGMTDFDISVKLTLPVVANGKHPAGIIACVDNVETPTNYMECYYFSTDAKVHLDLVVNGTSYPNLVATTVTYGVAKILRLVKVGDYVAVFYDGVQKGATQTISYASLANNTIHGLFNMHPTNDLDDAVIVSPIGDGGMAAPATPANNIFALGDSITTSIYDDPDFIGWPGHLVNMLTTSTGLTWYEKPARYAVGGWTTIAMADDIDGVLAARVDVPKYVCIYLGTNDGYWPDFTETRFKTDYRYVTDAIHAKWPSAKIYLMEVPGLPTTGGWIAALIAEHPTWMFDAGNFGTIMAGHPEYFTPPETVHPNHLGDIAIAASFKTKMGY